MVHKNTMDYDAILAMFISTACAITPPYLSNLSNQSILAMFISTLCAVKPSKWCINSKTCYAFLPTTSYPPRVNQLQLILQIPYACHFLSYMS